MFDCCTWHRGLFSVQKKYIQFSTFTLFLHFPPKKIKDSTGGVFLDILIRSLAWIFAASTWDSPWAIIDRKLDVLLLGSLFSFLRIVWVCRGGVRAPQADTGHTRVNISAVSNSNLLSILHEMYDSLSSIQEGGTQLNGGRNLLSPLHFYLNLNLNLKLPRVHPVLISVCPPHFHSPLAFRRDLVLVCSRLWAEGSFVCIEKQQKINTEYWKKIFIDCF